MVRSIVLAAAVAALVAVPAQADIAFDPNSWVEKPLADDAPLDPDSTTMVAALRAEVEAQANQRDVRQHPSVDMHWCTTRVYEVPSPRPAPVDVTLHPDTAWDLKLRDQLTDVPIPSYADTTTECADQPITIYERATDTLWEMMGAYKDDDDGEWHAYYGGKIVGVAQNPGHWESLADGGFGTHYGATATSLPMTAGLQWIDELVAGEIDHAVSFIMKAPAPCWRFPAQRMDGKTTLSHPLDAPNGTLNNPLAPPYGAKLRLPASLDVDALPVSRYTKVLAHAVQRYGMVVNNRGNQVMFQAEVPASVTGVPGHENDPYPYRWDGPVFGTTPADQAIKQFPWGQLQVVAVEPGHSPCQTSG